MKHYYFFLKLMFFSLTTTITSAQAPIAQFDATPTFWQAPSVVEFQDLSTSATAITNWTWTFDVGSSNTVTCSGCTGTNAQYIGQTPPLVTYPNPGLYTTSLTVTSANGTTTETKVDFITVKPPSSDCETLDTQWTTPTPTVISYGFGGGNLSGVPDPVNLVSPTDTKGVYEGYFTPNPGVTPIGSIRVGIGSLNDPNDNMTFRGVVYDDDGFGAPGALIGGSTDISPTTLGVPNNGSAEFIINFDNAPIPTTAFFHVGIEISAGDAQDVLIVETSCLGAGGCPVAQGENDASNHIFTSGFGYENLLTVYGADFDVNIIPTLSKSAPIPSITYTQDIQCGQTVVTINDSYTFSEPTGISYKFSQDGSFLNFETDPTGPIVKVYTAPGQDMLTIDAINSCSRIGSRTFVIDYDFLVDTNITQIDNNLTADQSGAIYQWVDCNNGNSPITGETNQSFTASAIGSYAVQITLGGCILTSNCINVTTLSNTDINSLSTNVTLYPNPSSGEATVSFKKKYDTLNIKITDITGKIITIQNLISADSVVFGSNLNPGMYFIEINTKTEKAILKFIKK